MGTGRCLQVWGLELNSQNSYLKTKTTSQVWWYAPVTPALGRQKVAPGLPGQPAWPTDLVSSGPNRDMDSRKKKMDSTQHPKNDT